MVKSKLSGKDIGPPVYRSANNRSLSSLSKISNEPAVVYFDETIGHLQTQEQGDVSTYYDEHYEIYNQSDEDDILYKVVDGKKIFRQDHQLHVLIDKLDLKPGTNVLDYGCGKGTVMKRLATKKEGVRTHLFDVSKMYEHLWKKFLAEDQYSSYQTKPEWEGSMDVVTSFFAFEHTPDPIKELRSIKKLLKDQGLVYLIVPNVFDNTADFILNDHVHHYSEVSLRYLLQSSGFDVVEIDPSSHFGAFIAIGKKTKEESLPFTASTEELSSIKKECMAISAYWTRLQDTITQFESTARRGKAAIYGAGVYGNFIATSLKDLSTVSCFIDQNELLHGETILDKSVHPVKDLPEDIAYIYVGINPKVARTVIEGIDAWKNRKIEYLFL